MKIHFPRRDERYCGSTSMPRCFTLDPNEVTCETCKSRDTFELTEKGYAYLASLGMNYYLCHWHDGSDNNHTVIKQGQAAVELWLQECLCQAGIGCPEEIVDQLTMLDEDAGHGGTPIQIMWQSNVAFSYTITEITDLGVFDND